MPPKDKRTQGSSALQCVDLSAASPTPSETEIAQIIRDRYVRDAIYTRIGARVLVSLNPGKPVPNSNDATCTEYANEYKDTTERETQLSPHIFQLTTGAYAHMRRTGLDQSIILHGEVGSGKTENRRLAIKLLATMRSQSKKEAKIFSQISAADTVLESFGNCSTVKNTNASRVGVYTEMQFSNRGRIVGCKILDYHLEKSRSASPRIAERNFHIFYQLTSGCTAEERTRWRLQEPAAYNILGQQPAQRLPSTSDEVRFEELRLALKAIGIGKKPQSQIFRAVSALLHLGNIQFVDPMHNSTEEAAYIKNDEQLVNAADMFGVHAKALETVLTYKQQLIKKDVVTILLNSTQAARQRDSLLVCIYGLLWSWLVEQINQKLCSDDEQASFIGILDLIGFQADGIRSGFQAGDYDQFVANFAAENVHNFYLHQVFAVGDDEMQSDGLLPAKIEYIDNTSCLDMLLKPRTGLLSIMDRAIQQSSSKQVTDDGLFLSFQRQHSDHPLFLLPTSRLRSFAIQHFAGQCVYDVDGFAESNSDSLSADFVTLFQGNGADLPGSVNAFISGLFEGSSVVLEAHARNAGVVVAAQQKDGPTRAPSMKKPKRPATKEELEAASGDEEGEKKRKKPKPVGAHTQVQKAIGELVDSLNETKPWFVLCVRPHETIGAGVDLKYVRAQTRYFQLSEVAARRQTEYSVSFTHAEFLEKYAVVMNLLSGDRNRDQKAKCEAAASVFGLATKDMCIGRSKVWLSDTAWMKIERSLRAAEEEAKHRQKAGLPPLGGGDDAGSIRSLPRASFMGAGPGSVYSDDAQSYISEDEYSNYQKGAHEAPSVYGSEGANNDDLDLKKEGVPLLKTEEEEETFEMTKARKQWLCCTWGLTWWIPTPLMSMCGLHRRDIQIAWREKVALCLIIIIMCLLMIFVITFLGPLICPKQNVFSMFELESGHSSNEDAYTAIRGEVFDITNYTVHHGVSFKEILQSNSFAGKDSSAQFPVQVSQLCDGVDGNGVDFSISLQNYTKQNSEPAAYHDFRWYRYPNRVNDRPDGYTNIMHQLRAKNKVGYVGWDDSYLQKLGRDNGRHIGVVGDQVFDFTDYNNGKVYTLFPDGSTGDGSNTKFMDKDLSALFSQLKGQDVTKEFDNIFKNKPPALKRRMQICMRNLFFVGKVDYRNSVKCRFSEIIMLAISILLVSVIIFKFLAALQLGSKPTPDDHDKFVICNVPCYTEDEESLRRTIDSLAVLKYDDKRKLLFIVADGMIVGSGNDRPTPRIVLDILGVDPSIDPEPLAFQSLGDGMKQLNYGKVYTGLYECRGHVVPYLVVIKVGKPTERQRPGNRGKRDSQMILMRFFNAVHYGKEMVPLELEIYHQIKNVIGVDPSFYEYVLMVDADTLVYPDSLNRMISCMVHDAKIMGICGETMLMNAKDSITTMMQVYEYYISHHLSKAFESLFGSVTCLPGCFCMYRLRTPDKGNPLLVHDYLITDYSENKVDTLHKKNLLHLGEDRYLTTLMLKHFPLMKMTFTSDAQCETNAPDSWRVLLSQRRRWINSTVHNLLELVFLERLCGFCCFSMRFVVFLDLFGTVVMPATVVYLIYLIYQGITKGSGLILVSLIMFAAVYGLQAIIFLLRRKWEHIGWMIVYILAIPLFGFFIPLYSFWHFDDFSWGNTRMVVGEKGKKFVSATEEEKFDPKSIPRKKWSEYEQETWETGTTLSRESDGKSRYGSEYGGGYRSSIKSGKGAGMQDPRMSGMQDPRLSGVQDPRMSGMQDPRMSGMYDPRMSGMQDPRMSGYSQLDMPSSPAFGMHEMRVPSPSVPGRAQTPVIYPVHSTPARSQTPTMSYRPQTPTYRPQTPTFQVPSRPSSVVQGPSDIEIRTEIQRLLHNADLMTVTKKQIRDGLTRIFGIDMTPRKEFINQCIEEILQS